MWSFICISIRFVRDLISFFYSSILPGSTTTSYMYEAHRRKDKMHFRFQKRSDSDQTVPSLYENALNIGPEKAVDGLTLYDAKLKAMKKGIFNFDLTKFSAAHNVLKNQYRNSCEGNKRVTELLVHWQ